MVLQREYLMRLCLTVAICANFICQCRSAPDDEQCTPSICKDEFIAYSEQMWSVFNKQKGEEASLREEKARIIRHLGEICKWNNAFPVGHSTGETCPETIATPLRLAKDAYQTATKSSSISRFLGFSESKPELGDLFDFYHDWLKPHRQLCLIPKKRQGSGADEPKPPPPLFRVLPRTYARYMM